MNLKDVSKPSLLLGSLFFLSGAILPSSAYAEFLSAPPTGVTSQLMVGATIFRISLAILGVAILIAGLPMWTPGVPSAKAVAEPRRNWILLALVFILIVATALRLYQLNAGLWLDEILTDVLFAKAPLRSIITTYESENQHFLYSVLAHISFLTFGESVWALRLPAVIFGVGSIWALYLLGREVAGPREALLSAALLAFSYTHVWFSQNARGYSGLLFWTILSSWLLLRALRESQPRLWIAYAAAAALGTYTHITMLFVVLGHFVIYAWTFAHRREVSLNAFRGLFLGFVFAGLFTLALYALVLPQILGGAGREASVVSEWKDPLWTVLEIVKGMQISFNSGILAAGALAVFGAGLWNYARTRPEIVMLMVIGPVVGAAVVVAMGHHLWPRFFLFAMGFAVLIVMRGAMQWAEWCIRVLRWPLSRSAWVGTALCAALILVSAISVPFAYGPKQDYVGALEFVRANMAPGDVVATAGLAAFPYTRLYAKDWQEVTRVEDLNGIRSRAKRTWLIYTFPTVLKSTSPDIMTSLGSDFLVVKEFYGTVGDGTIFVCRSDTPPSGIASH
jgi:4-amino-4-deoxy-L-arabinose transferase-like glycosyltransferase